MDDDEYQRMVDYENEIYDLNHGADQQSETDDSSITESESNDSDEDVSEGLPAQPGTKRRRSTILSLLRH